MNAPTFARHLLPASSVLFAGYDHDGLALDLHGYLDEDGYIVTAACVPGTKFSVNASKDLISWFCTFCDENLPTSEELLRASKLQARIEAAEPSY